MTNLKELIGYKDGMSADEIFEALGKANVDVQNDDDHNGTDNSEIDKYKGLISKANAEAAKYKKELKAKLSEQEAKELERNTQFEAMEEEIKALKQEKAKASYVSKFATLGYSSEQANLAAEAFMNNDIDALTKAQSAYLASKEDSIKEELMKATPKPKSIETGNGVPEAMTKERLYKMSLQDRLKFAHENPEEYKALNS